MINWFWIQFAAICIVGAMSPGPSLALIIRNSIKYGRVSGLLSSIGHAIGIGIYAAISVVGLQLILMNNIFVSFISSIIVNFQQSNYLLSSMHYTIQFS